MNALDKLIGYLDPKRGLRRMQSRAAMNVMEKRSYDGAKTGRRTGGWISASSSANAEIGPALSTLRNRSRDLVRNNPNASKAIRSLVVSMIGDGITAKLSDDTAQTLWNTWVEECDADGQLDFYGLQALIAQCWKESGECLIRLRYRRPADGLSVPLQLQVLEPDYICDYKNELLDNGGWIQSGIEFNAIGTRVAYWLYDHHPGDSVPILTNLIPKRIPATDVIHIYKKTRPGQIRGVPVLAASMLTMRDLDDYEEAELIRKGVEACFAAFVTTDDESKTMGIASTDPQNTSRRIENLSAGMIEYLRPNENVTFGAPSAVQGYSDYIRERKHSIAAGAEVTYELMTGDLEKVNYSSIRAGTQEFRRGVIQDRKLTFIPMVCTAILKAWANAAFIAGSVKSAQITAQWTAQRFDYVDPLKDITAEILELAAGLRSWSSSVRSRREDPATTLDEIATDQQNFKEKGVSVELSNLVLGLVDATLKYDASQTEGGK